MRRSLLAAAVSIAALTLAANRPIPELVREATLQSVLTIGYCNEVPDAPVVANPVFPSGSGTLRRCDGDPSMFFAALRIAMAAVAADKSVTGPLEWGAVDASFENFGKAEAKLLGKPFSSQFPAEANGWAQKWDPAALQAAFDAYYVKPSATLGGLRAQQVYDVVLKARVASLVQSLAVATHTPGLITGTADAIRAMKGGDARGTYYALAQDVNASASTSLDGSDFGWIVRRELDGTLPVIRKLLATLVKDYDPAAAQRLDDRKLGVNDGKVLVRLTGSNAPLETVTIDGKLTYCNGLCPPVRLAPGRHNVVAVGEDSGATHAFDVTAKGGDVVIPLVRTNWNLAVTTSPPAVQLTVDGRLLSRTPIQWDFSVGEHVLRVVDPCFEPAELRLNVGQTDPGPVVLNVKPRTAVLRVETVTFDNAATSAEWTIDGQAPGPSNADATVSLCSRKLVVNGANGRKFEEFLVLDPAKPTVRSFTVTEPPRPGPGERTFDATWTTLGRQALAGADRAAVRCPRQSGKVNPLWGDGAFTDDSSVCVAAQYRGRIDTNGGTFFIRRAPGRDSYGAGNANGVASKAFGKWSTSFEVE